MNKTEIGDELDINLQGYFVRLHMWAVFMNQRTPIHIYSLSMRSVHEGFREF